MSAADVGSVALARMFRDGVLAPLAPRHGMPRDIPVSPEARADSLAPVVPPHTVVSGLAGLWVRYGGPAPRVVDLVGARGLHRAKPGADSRGWALSFHSGRAATGPRDPIGGVVVANAERCAIDGLRWRDLATALEVVYLAVRAGILDPAVMDGLSSGDDARGLGAGRARSAWAALATALAPPESATPESVLSPFAPSGEGREGGPTRPLGACP